MCKTRGTKVNRGPTPKHLREARRLQRLQRVVSILSRLPPMATPDAAGHRIRLISEVTCRTVSLMHKSFLIQQQLIDLQKEMSEYVTSVMAHPENQRRYLEHLRRYGTTNAYVPIVADRGQYGQYPLKPIPISHLIRLQ